MVSLSFYTQDPPRSHSDDDLHVVLYDGSSRPGFPRIGGPIRQGVRRLGCPVDVRAFDFLTLALAVVAADTFVNRERFSSVGWARDLNIIVPLANPAPWAAVLPLLSKALAFLTGDHWHFEITDGGRSPPPPMTSRGNIIPLAGADLVCLFSGGLDSTIGVLDLRATGNRPLLVSHSYNGDAGKQQDIQNHACPEFPRLSLLANPSWPSSKGFDITMRGRSFGFLAMAAVAASALAPLRGARMRLVVPENGFIAVNAPLTRRRLGSLSTRTTHPHFLDLMQELFDTLDIPAVIENPYDLKTKGEMVRNCCDRSLLENLSGGTVSCGHWKRQRIQCGRCVPCLVRRASFHAALYDDPTPYDSTDLAAYLKPKQRGDLLALGCAGRWSATELSSAVGASGPLPADPALRAKYEDVVRRGLAEVRAYLSACNVAV